jgi:hypothetical protein
MEASRKEMLRTKHWEESQWDPYWQRYGLFSYPGSLAVADDTYPELEKRKLPKEEDYRKHVMTNAMKNGQLKEAYFSTYGYFPNPYDDSKPNRDREKAKDMYTFHGKPFLPGGRNRNMHGSPDYAI